MSEARLWHQDQVVSSCVHQGVEYSITRNNREYGLFQLCETVWKHILADHKPLRDSCRPPEFAVVENGQLAIRYWHIGEQQEEVVPRME